MNTLESSLYLSLALNACSPTEDPKTTLRFNMPPREATSPSDHSTDTGPSERDSGDETPAEKDSGKTDTASTEDPTEDLVWDSIRCSAVLGYDGDPLREKVDTMGLEYLLEEGRITEDIKIRLEIAMNGEIEKITGCTESCSIEDTLEECSFQDDTFVRNGTYDFNIYVPWDREPPEIVRTWITLPDRDPSEHGWIPTTSGDPYSTARYEGGYDYSPE